MSASVKAAVKATPPVLVLRALGLGDALTAVPALRALRKRFPDRPLLFAGPRLPGHLLRQQGIVDAVIPTPGLSGPPPGRGLVGHVAVNLHGRGPQSHRLLLAGDPVRLLAFASRETAVAGPPWNAREHEVTRWCRLAAWSVGPGPPPAADPTDLYLDPGPVRRRDGPVAIHPGAAGAARRWPPERFAAVAAALAGRGYQVVATGTSGEAALCRRVVAQAGLGPAADLSGRLALPNLVSLLAVSPLLICGDTGVAHLATALRTPSVLLFGPTSPYLWGPAVDVDLHRVLWHGRSDPSRDLRAAADPLLLQITVAETLQAALELLGQAGDAPEPRPRRKAPARGPDCP